MLIDVKYLACCMAEKQYNPPQLARVAKLNRITINRALRGNDLRLSTIGRIAGALGIKVSDLIIA